MPMPLVLIDSDCVLCDRSVHFIANRSMPGTFRFVARTSDEGRAAVRSDAALAIARRMEQPWRALAALRFVPRPLRDAAYDLVARNRYRWFGRLSP